jgi:hypothetical protein
MKTFFSKALANKILLNVVFVLSLFSIIGYIILGDITSVAMFMMLSLITVNFSKNMIIVLGLPMVIVAIFYAFINKRNRMMSSFREGMETKNEETKETENAEKENVETDVVKSGNGTMSMTAVNAEEKITNKKNNNASTDESFEVGRNKKGQYNIDYASTIEDAYDELNKILGSDGIKNLTDDTQKLMKQQMMLAESMQSMEPIIKGMGPLLEKAEGLLGNMGGDSPGNLDSLKKLAETFTGKKG